MEKNITHEDKSGSMFRVSGLDFQVVRFDIGRSVADQIDQMKVL